MSDQPTPVLSTVEPTYRVPANPNAQRITEESGVHKDWYIEAKETTVETLPAFIKKLTEDYVHDYGTICHAIAAGALATARAIDHSPAGGITGFQSGAIMWEFITRWGHIDGPARLLQYQDVLYPQCDDKFFEISKDTCEWLVTKAKELLAEDGGAHPNVMARWKMIAAGELPPHLKRASR